MAKEPNHLAAHVHSSDHREELLGSKLCGCFNCLEIYSPTEIDEWVDDDSMGVGKTALCQRCGIDSVIGSASGYPISKEYLKQMQAYWFKE